VSVQRNSLTSLHYVRQATRRNKNVQQNITVNGILSGDGDKTRNTGLQVQWSVVTC